MGFIRDTIRLAIQRSLNRVGWDLITISDRKELEGTLKLMKQRHPEIPYDFEDLHKSIFNTVKDCTMTSPDRLYSAIEAIRHLAKHNIEGDIVECGVFKGGSSMAMAMTLLDCGESNRNLYLYDTFSGMSEPTSEDLSFGGGDANTKFKEKELKDIGGSDWCYSPLEEVQSNMERTRYPRERIYFVKGKVEDTIPDTLPEKIAILRLDTDWYESTKHEMEHLFPRLVNGGILIIDDYGHWQGSKKAVDEYIKDNKIKLFLTRIDYTGRLAVKL